jgi:hypothetical protein
VRFDEGLNPKYVLASEEFVMRLFPTSQWKWEKKGAEEVKSVLKQDKRQYPDDLVMNMDGEVIHTEQIWTGKSTACLPHPDVRAQFPHFLFTFSENHWANLNTKIELTRVIWKWVVEQHIEDIKKEGRDLSRQDTESTSQCVWLLDCWWGEEELEVGEGGDDEDYEREDLPPSDIDGCDWDALSASFMT